MDDSARIQVVRAINSLQQSSFFIHQIVAETKLPRQTVWRNLEWLQGEGFLESESPKQGSRQAKLYRYTPEGRLAFSEI